MNKYALLFIMMIIGYQLSFSNPQIPSLKSLSTQAIFNFKNAEHKQEIDQCLIDGDIDIPSLKFKGVVLKGVDMSKMYLRGIDFSGCHFIDVDLQDADLTETKWDGARLDGNIKLKGAIYYYPLDQNKQPIIP